MSQCSKDRERHAVSKYLFIILTGIFFLLISSRGFAQDSSHRKPPPPPPHRKLKEMVDKIKKLNPFKKKDKSNGSNPEEQANVKDDPKKTDPIPPPPPPPDPVKPKSNTNSTHKTTSTKKKPKSTKPATDTKGKVTTPLI